jgi:flagellar assembly protein FliH
VRPRARILTGESGVSGKPILSPGISEPARRRFTREEVEGRNEAERVVRHARAEADRITAQAREQAADAATVAVRDAEADARARVAVECLAIRQAEQKRLDRDRDRIIAVAVVLAERLLGASLAIDPSSIASLARGVLAEAGGARRAVIDSHPLDAHGLREHLSISGLDLQSVEVRDDLTLARGELRLHTDVGTIDAKLALRFDRLAAALHDVLR